MKRGLKILNMIVDKVLFGGFEGFLSFCETDK